MDIELDRYILHSKSMMETSFQYRVTILFSLSSIISGVPIDFGQELNFELLKKFDISTLHELGQKLLNQLTNSERVRVSLNENNISEKLVDNNNLNDNFSINGLRDINKKSARSEDQSPYALKPGNGDVMIDFAHDELILENVNNSKSLELQGAGEENFRSEDPDYSEGSGSEIF